MSLALEHKVEELEKTVKDQTNQIIRLFEMVKQLQDKKPGRPKKEDNESA